MRLHLKQDNIGNAPCYAICRQARPDGIFYLDTVIFIEAPSKATTRLFLPLYFDGISSRVYIYLNYFLSIFEWDLIYDRIYSLKPFHSSPIVYIAADL